VIRSFHLAKINSFEEVEMSGEFLGRVEDFVRTETRERIYALFQTQAIHLYLETPVHIGSRLGMSFCGRIIKKPIPVGSLTRSAILSEYSSNISFCLQCNLFPTLWNGPHMLGEIYKLDANGWLR